MGKKFTLPTISAQEFRKSLKNRKFEDPSVIHVIERYFKKTRGYIFRMPKPNTPVVLLASGGLDSTIAWAILMKVFHLHVYPLCVGKHNRQYMSLLSIAKVFKRQYPRYYHAPYILDAPVIPGQFRKFLHTSRIHTNQIMKRFNVTTGAVDIDPFNGLNSFSLISAYIYSQILELSSDLHVDTVFCGIVAGDGTIVRSQTLTFIRQMTMIMSQFSGNIHFQYTSVFFEKETHVCMDKNDEILLAKQLGVPMLKTYSCYNNTIFHCGECVSCKYRQFGFEKSGLPDPTNYWRPHASFTYHCVFLLNLLPQPIYTVLRTIKRFLVNVNK